MLPSLFRTCASDIVEMLRKLYLTFHYTECVYRYDEGLELEDAVHTAILTLKVNEE